MVEKSDPLPPEHLEPQPEPQSWSVTPVPTPANPGNPEEIQRIQVDPEDRLAFRVGVNILTLLLIGLGAWLIWRQFFAAS